MEHNKTFKDIQGHWAKEEIEIMVAKHIAKGKVKDNFAPNDIISRAEFTDLIVRVLGLEGSENNEYAPEKAITSDNNDGNKICSG
ncbi:S-layer homology domain-containing protein [Abyssisolibacter fermentans]|uniref:S-layer homology domain-containing protein n=1 Tax=Abyssisolibacter fermentans TaxID=1766203 RepID=UPI0012E3DC4E|nr:S-layer homology domain-containing protein [Abyssisolibacter fermentans]